MAARKSLRWAKASSIWIYRTLTWSVLVAGLLFGTAVLGLRYWILPNIGQYRQDIARIISEAAHQKIEIGYIRGNWDGLRPQLVLEEVRVLDAEGRRVLQLSRVDATVSWLSLAALQPRFRALYVHRPMLEVRRDTNGAIFVAGIKVGGNNAFANWLLRQRDVEVIDAKVAWTDEQRVAPRVEFKHAHLRMINRGSRHRFGLQALPPRELAAPLDLRGDLRGDSIDALSEWSGKIFLQLDYADIAAWRQWIPFPVEFPRGQGAVRAWLDVRDLSVIGATVDLRLANVQTRLAPDLPELDLTDLSGRIGWNISGAGFEVSTAKLGLTTIGGLSLAPTDLRIQVLSNTDRATGRGELQVDEIELEPVVALADRLPLGRQTRDYLERFSPRGNIRNLALRWRGDWQKPTEFSIRGHFEKLALGHFEQVPGFKGVSGSVDASEKGGALQLNTEKAVVDMPLVFRDRLEFDVLTAQINWERRADEIEVKINSVSFSNSHVAGTVFGNYQTAGASRGYIDLTGRLTRADARFVHRYIPLVVNKATRDWLDTAFLAGQTSDATLRLKGNLDEFPFPDGRGGIFQVAVKVTAGTLKYAENWPRIENIAGDVVFRGKRLDVYARHGTVLGATIEHLRAEIPDLVTDEEWLHIAGEARGPTAEFLDFIDKTPMVETTGRFTEGWRAEGLGILEVKLDMPLDAIEKTKVAGTFRIDNNTVSVNPDVPPVASASGQVEFTESSMRAKSVRGLALGGPITISANTTGDGTVGINLHGHIDTDKLPDGEGLPDWTQHLRGSTDWRATITARKGTADIVVESNLQGMAVYLPPPLLKPAGDTWPVRLERRIVGPGRDRIAFSAGKIVDMRLERQVDGATVAIPRGVVRFGEAAGGLERAGVWIGGNIGTLDLDRWLALLRQSNEPMRVEWGGVDLEVSAMDALGRRYHDLSIHAVAQPGGIWRSNLVGRELEGTLLWQPQDQGRLTARMKTLSIPVRAPPTLRSPGVSRKEQGKLNLPALDITAEQFSLEGKTLGSLEVSALPQGVDWRIERLKIVNPESTFTLEGLWQGWLTASRTRVNIHLDAQDAGKLLDRLGYPEGLERGTARIEGALSWQGAPYEIDYPSLSGNLVLVARKGQFEKVNTGVGKLLGVMSLQALPRRVSLDFRDVFSDGFAFDEIVGPVKIDHGIAITENLRIQGPSARIIMSGKVDLARETQDLRVRVTPFLGDSVSIAGALIGGPVAGVATFLAQKMLKDPIDNMAAFEYDVTGTWTDPMVTKIKRQLQSDGPNPGS